MNDRPQYIAWHRETGRHYVLHDWDEAMVFLWGKKADEWDLYRQVKIPLNLSREPDLREGGDYRRLITNLRKRAEGESC